MKHDNKQHLFLTLALVVLIFIPVSCGQIEGEPKKATTDPSSTQDFSGVWRGYLLESTTGNFGETVLTLEQNLSSVTGNWTAYFSTSPLNEGSLSGNTNQSNSASFRLEPTVPGYCAMDVTVAINGDEAEGNYNTTSECTHYFSSGTLHVFRDTEAGKGYTPVIPPPPMRIGASTGGSQNTVCWSNVSAASGFNMYWDTNPGVTPATGNMVERVINPQKHLGLVTDTSYYYVITSTNLSGESVPSEEISAIPTVGSSLADIVFMLDTTGSMSSEISGVKDSVLAFANYLVSVDMDIRLGGAAYSDSLKDTTPLSPDISSSGAFYAWVSGLTSCYMGDCGGDGPENFLDPIAYVMDNFSWRTGAQKILIIITDAPTHVYGDGTTYTNWSIDTLFNAKLDGVATVHSVSPGTTGVRDARYLSELSGGVWSAIPSTGNFDLTTLPMMEAIASKCQF